jgi:methionine-rich copper-binding protein CopC
MRTPLFVAFVLFALTLNGSAHAHAMLASASPPVGGAVGAAPRQVTLSFTQGLEPSFSSVQVTDSKGARRYRQSPSQRQYDERRSESVVPGDLQGELACAFGRHTQDARKLLVPRRPVI